MEKRNYISQEYHYNLSKVPFAVTIKAENTTLHTIERMNGAWRYDGQKGEKIIFTIEYVDFKYSITSKVKDTCETDKEWIYTKYALTSMDCADTYEEYYKAALLIQKNRLIATIKSYEEDLKKFKKTGYWPYPINTDPKMYKRSYELNKKVANSIDVTEKDLKFFKGFTKIEN